LGPLKKSCKRSSRLSSSEPGKKGASPVGVPLEHREPNSPFMPCGTGWRSENQVAAPGKARYSELRWPVYRATRVVPRRIPSSLRTKVFLLIDIEG
jgi:hypothetical protein